MLNISLHQRGPESTHLHPFKVLFVLPYFPLLNFFLLSAKCRKSITSVTQVISSYTKFNPFSTIPSFLDPVLLTLFVPRHVNSPLFLTLPSKSLLSFPSCTSFFNATTSLNLINHTPTLYLSSRHVLPLFSQTYSSCAYTVSAVILYCNIRDNIGKDPIGMNRTCPDETGKMPKDF